MKVFDIKAEEEQYFPYNYSEISLEEARIIRYLISNALVFSNSEIVTMSLNKKDKKIIANAHVYNENANVTFDSDIYRTKTGYKMYTVITEILSHKNYYSIDTFEFLTKDIKVTSKIEGMEEVERNIDYMCERGRKL